MQNVLSIHESRIGVLGATSLVGACLLPLMVSKGWQVTAYSRHDTGKASDGLKWQKLAPGSYSLPAHEEQTIDQWICLAPIWVLPDYFDLLTAHGAKRVVALSSTSIFTKNDSSDIEEQAIVQRLVEAENRLQTWAEKNNIEWVVLRPTLIYGLGRDKNICEISRFIQRFGFFPVFGKACGLRQPIHALDVADACIKALQEPAAANHSYNLSGGETLPYRDMVARIFVSLGRPARLLTVPLSAFRVAVAILRCLPRYRHWSVAMAERMNRDLVFEHGDAERDLGFKPRGFALSSKDIAT